MPKDTFHKIQNLCRKAWMYQKCWLLNLIISTQLFSVTRKKISCRILNVQFPTNKKFFFFCHLNPRVGLGRFAHFHLSCGCRSVLKTQGTYSLTWVPNRDAMSRKIFWAVYTLQQPNFQNNKKKSKIKEQIISLPYIVL